MKLAGLHHVTMITGDARRNVEFWADVLGLRLVKKTVNFDQPHAYHLYFGDERGTPGSILTWFEFAGAGAGRAGAGMIHTLALAVPGAAAFEFWHARLARRGHASELLEDRVRLRDPDGLAIELVAAHAGNPPLAAMHPEVGAANAIVGIEGARAYGAPDRAGAALLTDTLGFTARYDQEYLLDGTLRHFHWGYDPAPDAPGLQGAGTVHHIAWACEDSEQLAWRARVAAAGAAVTGVRDRDYFKSIYFNEPRGVLFEIATLSPGFAVDEDPGHLGEQLRIPAMHAHLRDELERTLVPLANPRAAARA